MRLAAQRILGISSIRGANIVVVPNDLSVDTETIRVEIQVPYSQNTLFLPFFTRGLNIRRSCELTRESAS
ncbi:MAG: hypothetical protein ACE361_26585 [Aureliella sp.]